MVRHSAKQGVPTLSCSRTNDMLTLAWQGSFTLQAASNVAGPYIDIPAATNHYHHWIDPAAPEHFFRLRIQFGP